MPGESVAAGMNLGLVYKLLLGPGFLSVTASGTKFVQEHKFATVPRKSTLVCSLICSIKPVRPVPEQLPRSTTMSHTA